jgi:hypothetical protein
VGLVCFGLARVCFVAAADADTGCGTSCVFGLAFRDFALKCSEVVCLALRLLANDACASFGISQARQTRGWIRRLFRLRDSVLGLQESVLVAFLRISRIPLWSRPRALDD